MIPIYEADRLEDLPLFDRPPQAEEDVDAAVAAILADVRTRGDEALREYTRRFDGADLERFEVTAEELRAAWTGISGRRCGRRRTISGTSMRHRSTGTSA